MTAPARVLLVGFDAADPELVVELARTGRLPTVASLLERGTAAPVATPPGLFVGAVWPTLATGVSAARHGRYCYAQLRPGTYEVYRVGGTIEPYDPFWVTTARAGRRTTVIDVPHSRLAPELDLQVVDWSSHDPNVGFRTWPPDLGADLVERFGRMPDDQCNDFTRRGALGELRDELVASVRRKADFVETVVARGDWELLTFVFGESHCAGHQFWALHDPRHPAHDPARARALGDPLVEIYTELDAALGRILHATGGDALTLLLLSHGMGPHYDATFVLSEMLRRIDDADRPPTRRVVGRERTRRAARGVLHRRRRAREGFVHAVDGSRRFFQIPNNDVCGGIRINLSGREPAGLVGPGDEFEATCKLIEDGLAEWRNAETGARLVRCVTRTNDHYSGPAIDHLPDLLVEWDRREPIRSVASARYGHIDRRPTGVRTGDHRPGGLLVACGPHAARAGETAPISAVDLAPTICAGLEVPTEGVEGRARLVIGA